MIKKRKTFLPFYVPSIDNRETKKVAEVLKSGWLTTGKYCELLEDKFCEYTGSRHAVTVSSCTAGLYLSLKALDIPALSEVITTPLTFTATAQVIANISARPVFVDVEPDTYNINPEKIEEKITKKTRAIIPVDFSGHSCDYDKIKSIAGKYNLKVITDAAHSLGTFYKGRQAGTLTDTSCFSFYANKHVTTGEGGIITLNSKRLADKLRSIRLHGIGIDAWKRYGKKGAWHYEVVQEGFKYNLPDVLAVIGCVQMDKFKVLLNKRLKLVRLYRKLLRGISEIQFQATRDYTTHSHLMMTICLNVRSGKINRDMFVEQLKSYNIGASVHFIPLHLHKYYRKKFGYKRGDFPAAEHIGDNIISLPLFPDMKQDDVKYVAVAIKEILGYQGCPGY